MELQKIYLDEKGLVTAFAESRIGGRAENQDSLAWADTQFGYLVVVCDGMGGGPSGQIASTMAVNEVVESIGNASKEEELSNIIIKAVRRANMAIIERGNENSKYKGMGSTLTLLLVNEKSAFIAHVGDSRVYQLRGHRKVFRTFDHSMVFEMVEQGVITEEQARLSAQSNVITRALGIKPDVDVEIHEVSYLKGDRFLLCTDGIHGSMPEPELINMASNSKSKLGVIVDDIATFVDNLGRMGGGNHDNLTLAIAETKKDSILKSKMSRKTKIIFASLAVVALICLVLNFVQYSNYSSLEAKQQETITLLNDSIKKQNDSIANVRQSMAEIAKIMESAKSDNKTIESIKSIIEKSAK